MSPVKCGFVVCFPRLEIVPIGFWSMAISNTMLNSKLSIFEVSINFLKELRCLSWYLF